MQHEPESMYMEKGENATHSIDQGMSLGSTDHTTVPSRCKSSQSESNRMNRIGRFVSDGRKTPRVLSLPGHPSRKPSFVYMRKESAVPNKQLHSLHGLVRQDNININLECC